MNTLKIAGLLLLIAGILALAYGGFTYTKETHDVSLGPLKLEVKEKEHVNVPLWAGVALAIAGGVLLANPRSRG